MNNDNLSCSKPPIVVNLLNSIHVSKRISHDPLPLNLSKSLSHTLSSYFDSRMFHFVNSVNIDHDMKYARILPIIKKNTTR